MMMFSGRLANLTGDAKYMDVLERILYNGFAAGRSLDGTRLYYNNYMNRKQDRGRMGIACCASNIVRVVPSISGYQYGTNAAGIWTHLYMAGQATIAGATATLNGGAVDVSTASKGYLPITRTWKSGDVVRLNLPLQVRRVYSNPKVSANQGRVAIARGPIVYCLESNDNGTDVHKIVIPFSAPLNAQFDGGLLGGVTKSRGRARTRTTARRWASR
jgi:DUF1680 family protein